MTGRTCSDCPSTISKGAKKGRCRSCAMRVLNSDPTVLALRADRLRAVMQTPAWRAKHAAAAKVEGERRKADPVIRAKLSEAGRRHGAKNLPKSKTAEAIAKNTRARRISMQAWCPEAYWSLNRKLRENGHLLAERKRIIGEQVAADEQRRLAAMSPFERQAERLRNGARLVERVALPRREYAFSLTGSSL